MDASTKTTGRVTPCYALVVDVDLGSQTSARFDYTVASLSQATGYSRKLSHGAPRNPRSNPALG